MIRIGLKNLHYAIITENPDGTLTYGTPIKIPGISKAGINPNVDSGTFFGDDGPMETASSMGQIDLELEVADIPMEDLAALLGHTIDENGIVLHSSDDVPPWVAIGFQSLKSNGKYRYIWLLKGKFREPEEDFETKGESVNFQPATISASFVKRDSDNLWRKTLDEDAKTFNPDIAAQWFTKGPDNMGVTP